MRPGMEDIAARAASNSAISMGGGVIISYLISYWRTNWMSVDIFETVIATQAARE